MLLLPDKFLYKGLYVQTSGCFLFLYAIVPWCNIWNLWKGTKVEQFTNYLSGSGKSCLLGSWSLHHQEKFPNDAVVYHFVGSSSDSTGKQFSIFVTFNELLKRVHLLNQQQKCTLYEPHNNFRRTLNVSAIKDYSTSTRWIWDGR